MRKLLILAAAVGTATRAIAIWPPGNPPTDLPAGVSSDDYQAAARSFEHRHGRPPLEGDVLVWLAEERFRDGDDVTAVECYAQIPSNDPQYGQAARSRQGQLLLLLKQARSAERNLRECLELEKPGSNDYATSARQWLSYLLGVELRFEERHEVLRTLVERGEASEAETLTYCFPSLMFWHSSRAVSELEAFWKEDPADIQLKSALGRYRMVQGMLEEAMRILEDCRRERPDDRLIEGAWLACLHEQNDWEALLAAGEKLPPSEDSDPALLLRMRGHIAHHQMRYREAVDSFQRALKWDATNAECFLGLSRAFAALGEPRERADALKKAQAVARVKDRLGQARQSGFAVEPLWEIADLCSEAGLDGPALIVARLIQRKSPNHAASADLVNRLEHHSPGSSHNRVP